MRQITLEYVGTQYFNETNGVLARFYRRDGKRPRLWFRFDIQFLETYASDAKITIVPASAALIRMLDKMLVTLTKAKKGKR